jgi:hypothetical protein
LTNKRVWIAITVLVWLVALGTWRSRCVQAWLSDGIDVARCPDGALRQTVALDAAGLRRGGPGRVTLAATVHYTTCDADADHDLRASAPAFGAIALSLTGGRGPARPLEVAGWEHRHGAATAELTLPEVPDGDYQLHASYRTPLGSGEVVAPLALYTPARIHVITDRPLYQPGNTVRFRAVALRARDLAPLDHRPGTWVIRDPGNEVLLEEAAPAGEWGVVSGSFPLDKAAASGEWKVAWRSGAATDEVAFTVEPFTLPRSGSMRPPTGRSTAPEIDRASRARWSTARARRSPRPPSRSRGRSAVTGRRPPRGRTTSCPGARRPRRAGGSTSRYRRSPAIWWAR